MFGKVLVAIPVIVLQGWGTFHTHAYVAVSISNIIRPAETSDANVACTTAHNNQKLVSLIII